MARETRQVHMTSHFILPKLGMGFADYGLDHLVLRQAYGSGPVGQTVCGLCRLLKDQLFAMVRSTDPVVIQLGDRTAMREGAGVAATSTTPLP